VTATLLRSGVIKFQEQDRHLATLLFNDTRPNLVNYVAGLIRECLSHDPPIASQSQFACCIEVLAKLFQAGKTTEEYV
jgi:CCR4-NOT transcription complex subunit 1